MRAFGPEFMTQARWGESGVKGASGHGGNSLTKVIKGETFVSTPQPPGYSQSAGLRQTTQ
jgi:hypothetical protein